MQAEPSAEYSAPPITAHDGRTMIGHVVLATGLDAEERESIAVWHVSTNGLSTGAWILPIDLSHPDPATARAVLALCLRRAVIAWNPFEPLALLKELEHASSVAAPMWADTAIALPEIFDEVCALRSACEKRAMEERSSKKKVALITWPIALPEGPHTTEADLWNAVRLVLPRTNPVARDALRTANLIRWIVQRWRETTIALGRRPYLEREFGPVGHLAATWEQRLADAYAKNLRLTELPVELPTSIVD
jgi:hypothetical protein